MQIKKKLHRLNEFRKRFILTDKEAKEIDEALARIKEHFNKKTASFKGDWCWDVEDFLQLLNIADNDYMGKTKAITYAFKLGFLYGNGTYEFEKTLTDEEFAAELAEDEEMEGEQDE